MDNKTVYTKKAEAYARYRWDYATEAVITILQTAGISPLSAVADIGAGTGILTRHLIGKAGAVFAIELNYEMQLVARNVLGEQPGLFHVLAPAEATGLPDLSVDLITVAQAIHWFDPIPARDEFRRILKPGGWLATVRNYSTDEQVNRATLAIWTPENGVTKPAAGPAREPVSESFYFAPGKYQKLSFLFTNQVDFEAFLGSMVSASFIPDQDHPLFPNLAKAAKDVFDRFSSDGCLTIHGVTELYIGQIE